MALRVDENGFLKSGSTELAYVMRGTEFIRNFKEYSDSVPGKDGEILFGVDMEAGLINLPCFVSTTPGTWDAKETQIMSALNPKLGTQELTFANKPGKVFEVIYVGQLRLTEEGPNYRKFTLPFKVHKGKGFASTQGYLEGAGTAVNSGNEETPVIVEIVGSVTNPSVVVGTKTMTYTGQVTASDKLVIDTEKLTATFNGANALANYNGVFPKLAVGENAVTVSGGTVKITWLNRFI